MRMDRVGRAVALILLPIVLGGCSATLKRALGWVGFGPSYAGKISEEELRDELASYAQRFSVGVVTTADRIAHATEERRVRRFTIEWKLRMLSPVQIAVGLQDPQESYVALLLLAISQRQYLAEGEGKALFGRLQGDAVTTADRLVEDALAVGERFLTEKELEGIRWQVEDLAYQFPIRGIFQPETVVRGYAQAESSGSFTWVVSIPMSPFRALEGVDTAAQAIRDFNVTAREFAGFVALLPDRLTWQTELLLYDFEDRETTTQGLAAFEKIADSAERLTITAERLPVDVRMQVEALLAEVNANQSQLQATIGEARAGLAALDQAMTQASSLSQSLTALTTEVDRAGQTWRGVVDAALGPEERRRTAEPGRPFDILDYERTAGRIEAAAAELRGLATEIGGAQSALTTFVDGLWLRLAGLLVVFFVLRFGFRRVEDALARRGRGGSAR